MNNFFISADWSGQAQKRAVWVADLRGKRLFRPETAGQWSLDALLELARSLAGRVLVGIDVGFGVSRAYWKLVVKNCPDSPPGNFVQWLSGLDVDGEFFTTITNADHWRVGQPWFAVPRGAGSLTAFVRRMGDGLRRELAVKTGAKPIFIVSGIPGTVGSGTRAIWRELIPLLRVPRDFALWPFEGDASLNHPEHKILLAETYPSLAYAAALAEELPAAPVRVAKTRAGMRGDACDLLGNALWVRKHRVDIGDLEPARASEDHFDALFTAAAVLRCAVEGLPIVFPRWIDAEVEGSMLLAGPVDPARKATRLRM